MLVSVQSVVIILIVSLQIVFVNIFLFACPMWLSVFSYFCINQNWVQELILAWHGFDPNDNDPFKFGTAASVAILTQLNSYTNISK